jgi:hypothetical protein
MKMYPFTSANIRNIKREFQDFKMRYPHRHARLVNTEHSLWDDLLNTKDCYNCFWLWNTEDIRHCYFLNDAKDCMDVLYYGNNVERWYRSISIGWNAQNIYFCFECYDNVSNLFYCDNCVGNVKNCFACVGLKNKQYCILNKQYTKEEYDILVPQIIEHMRSQTVSGWLWERWQFFPSSFSPFAYNESLAHEHFPLDKVQARKLWFNRTDKEYNIEAPEWIATLSTDQLPETIQEVHDDILDKAIVCEITHRPFRIVSKELELYRKLWIPLPHKHPNQRHKERFDQVNPKRLRDRKCMKCWIAIQTAYTPDRKEIIYCEDCYNKEIYG